MFVMRSSTQPKRPQHKNVYTILLPQNQFCYLVLNLVAKICYHRKKWISRPAPLCLEGQFVWRISVPRWICTCVPIWCQSVQPFDSFNILLNIWPPNPPPPPMPPWGIVGANCFLACVNSQMNSQTCTEFGANRSIRLAAFPDLNLWPPKTPEMPLAVLMGELYLAMSIPRRIRRHVPNLVPIGRAIPELPQNLNLWPPKTPPKCPLGDCGATCI